MSMKKIIAGVAAATLTVSSLAVVGVSAEDTVLEQKLTATRNKVTLNYSKTADMRGVGVNDVFRSGETLVGVDEDNNDVNTTEGYKVGNYTFEVLRRDGFAVGERKDFESYLNKSIGNVEAASAAGTRIVVTGLAYDDKTVVTKTATIGLLDKKTPFIEVIKSGSTYDNNMFKRSYQIDLRDVKTITSIQFSKSFTLDAGTYTNLDQCEIKVIPDDSMFADVAAYGSELSQKMIPTPSYGTGVYMVAEVNVKDNDFPYLTFSNYDQGITLRTIPIVDEDEERVYNLLKFVNQSIVENKGAKLKVYFAEPDKLSGGVGVTKPNGTDVNDLRPGATDGTQNDITLGVNYRNTSSLRQTVDIVDRVATFDWDAVVSQSTSTVSGNVDSLILCLRKASPRVQALIKEDNAGNEFIGIEKIEVVIPEQQNAPVEETFGLSTGSGITVDGPVTSLPNKGVGYDLRVQSDIGKNYFTYNISLIGPDGKEAQPTGKVSLTLPIPEANKGKTIKDGVVKHGLNDGTTELLPIQNLATYKTDGYVKVETSKFSPFTVEFAAFGVDFEDDETTTEEATTEAPVEETTTEAPVEEVTTEATAAPNGATNGAAEDKNAGTGVALAVVPAAVAAAAVVISKKRK